MSLNLIIQSSMSSLEVKFESKFWIWVLHYYGKPMAGKIINHAYVKNIWYKVDGQIIFLIELVEKTTAISTNPVLP